MAVNMADDRQPALSEIRPLHTATQAGAARGSSGN